DNHYYLRKGANIGGTYEVLDQGKLLSADEINDLTDDERSNGIDPARYQGRHYLPFDKGGESNAAEGWLPNYFVPTAYFINWPMAAVERLRTHTSDRQEGRIAARFQNP